MSKINWTELFKAIINLLNGIGRVLSKRRLIVYPVPSSDSLEVTPLPPVLTIPHPEEKPDYTQTIESTDACDIVNNWLLNYDVPPKHWEYWKTAIDVQVYDPYPDYMLLWGISPDTPAFAWEAVGQRHMAIKPAFLNAGVISHEQSHNSYALLGEQEKAEFSAIYTPLITTDPLIKLLYSQNTYGLTSTIEGHAECYRYLGQQIPQELKRFYPKLF